MKMKIFKKETLYLQKLADNLYNMFDNNPPKYQTPREYIQQIKKYIRNIQILF